MNARAAPLLAIFFAAAPATAQPAAPASAAIATGDAARAKEDYQSCVRHANLMEWKQAEAACKEAYLLAPEPAYLYTLGQILRFEGDAAGAIHYYRLYLDQEGGSLSAGTRAGIEKLIAEEQAAASAQAKEVARAPTSSSPASAPAASPRSAMRPPAPSVVVAQTVAPWYENRLGDVLLAGGVAAAGVGTGLLFDAEGTVASANSAQHLGDWHAADGVGTERWIAAGCVAAGVALAGVAVWRFVRRTPDESRVALSAAPLRGGGALAVSGSF